MRKLKISNEKQRDAEISFGGIPIKNKIKYVLPSGENTQNIKVLKSPIENQYESLYNKNFQNPEGLTDSLIHSDPELNLLLTGKYVRNTQKLLINNDLKPVFKVQIKELTYLPDGTLKEEKDFVPKHQNINEVPIKWTGRRLKKIDAYNRFVFLKKYQLTHVNGLTYDFLFDMAKELSDNEELMMMGGGIKGNEPLVFQENGKPYRAFLEGRIKGEAYLLLLHLTNLEFKPII